MAKKTTTKQAPKRARSDAARKRKPPAKHKPKGDRPEDHPNFQGDLPEGYLQNTNPRQNQTY